jgi:hypothetical protein
MKKLLFGAAALIGLAYASLVGGPMDGSTWEVKIKPDSLFSLSHRELLVFQKGRLSVAGSLAAGFPPALYNARQVDGADEAWSAALSQTEGGIVTWSGLVRGDTIEGMVVWWAKNSKPRRFTFKGARKTA